MLRRFAFFAALVGLASPAIAQQPVQWRYSFDANGVATARYPGNTIVDGTQSINSVSINSTDYRQPPNYAGTNNAPVTVVQGTSATPSTTASAVGFFEKTSSAVQFDALAGIAFKTATTVNTRASAVYGEAIDSAGGTTTFVEGGRFQGTLLSGSNGSAYGAICAAGATSGSTTPAYVIGCEGNPINQKGPNAPTYATFNKDRFSAGFVATNGCPACGAFQADAGFVVNPYSETPFRTGLLIAENSINDTGIAFRTGLSIVNGIDMGTATISYSALTIPNNTPVRAKNAASTNDLTILLLDASNNLNIGGGVAGQIVMAAQTYINTTLKFNPYTVATLPACNAGNNGAMAYATDINGAATYNGAVAGGGTTRSTVLCNGTAWTQH